MSAEEIIAASGQWGTVEWGMVSPGTIPPAKKFFDELSPSDKAKVLALFQRLANFGLISSKEKFKQLGKKAGAKGKGLWEFKSFQIRFFGNFKPGKRFVVVHGLIKKQDELKKADIETAVKALAAYDAVKGGKS